MRSKRIAGDLFWPCSTCAGTRRSPPCSTSSAQPAATPDNAESENDAASSPTSSPSPPPKRPKQAVTLAWVSADGKLRAEVQTFVGDYLLAAATRAAEVCGDEPPQAGCYSGSCGVCEIEMRRKKNTGGGGGGLDGAPAVVRSCISVVPAGYELVELSPLADDAIWGVDAWDT